MQFSAAQIAQMIGGRVEGNEQAAVKSFGKIEEAKAGQLAFLANPKYEDYLYSTEASIIIVNEGLVLKQPVNAALIRVADAYTAFATLLDKYQQIKRQMLSGREEPSFVHETARIGDNVYIGAFVYIGENAVIGNGTKIFPGSFIGSNAQIGNNSIINAGVKIYHECKIGNNVTLHSGVVIGSDGFGFAPQADGSLKKVPQIGNVVVEDDVEIGSNTTIDRATIGSTIIKASAKLDNLLQIAHNVEIGSNTVIAAQTGISGSTKIGSNAMIGGQAGIVGHIQIADGTKIQAKTGISKSITEPNTSWGGIPSMPGMDYAASLRLQATLRNLPELEKKVKELEKELQELKRK